MNHFWYESCGYLNTSPTPANTFSIGDVEDGRYVWKCTGIINDYMWYNQWYYPTLYSTTS